VHGVGYSSGCAFLLTFLHLKVSKGVSVEDFIDRLASMRYTEVDVHFKPQWFLCGACEGGITYDRLVSPNTLSPKHRVKIFST